MSWRRSLTMIEARDLDSLDLSEKVRKDSALTLESIRSTSGFMSSIFLSYHRVREIYDEKFSGRHEFMIWKEAGKDTVYVTYEIEE